MGKTSEFSEVFPMDRLLAALTLGVQCLSLKNPSLSIFSLPEKSVLVSLLL